MINELALQIHKNNVSKGFYESEKNIGEMLALIHSEVSEALECDRKNKYLPISIDTLNMAVKMKYDDEFKSFFENKIKDTFQDELADIMIRVMDLAAFRGFDLDASIEAKVRYNTLRPHKHGKLY